MTDNNYELSRRKTLAALGTIGAAGAAAGFGTSAFFSDQETFTNNKLVAGELDLKVAVSQHYVDWLPDTDTENGNVSPDSPQETDDASMPDNGADLTLEAGSDGEDTEAHPIELDIGNLSGLANGSLVNEVNGGVPLDRREESLCDIDAGGDDDDAEREIVQLQDVKPGDFGIIRFEVASCTNPAFLWASGAIEDKNENGYTEPEREDPDESGDADDDGQDDTVELLDEVQLALVGGDVVSALSGGATVSPQATLRDLEGGYGMPLEGDIPAPSGGGAEGARDCFEGESNYRAFLLWWLPVNHANEVQSDSVTFSLGIYGEQCRHNDGQLMGNNGDIPVGGGGEGDGPNGGTDGDQKAISFIAFCAEDGLSASDISSINVIGTKNGGEPIEVDWSSDTDVDTVVVKAGTEIENFTGGTTGTVTSGDGETAGTDQTASDPCPVGESGPKYNWDGATSTFTLDE